jgi:hypothetical protein
VKANADAAVEEEPAAKKAAAMPPKGGVKGKAKAGAAVEESAAATVATSEGGGAEAKAERTREVIMRMIDRNERQKMLFLWRLNATRAKASALAVWAVDQGNRKAYEVERSLMAENRRKF